LEIRQPAQEHSIVTLNEISLNKNKRKILHFISKQKMEHSGLHNSA